MCSENDHPPYDLTATVPTCDAMTATEVVAPGGYGIERVPCRQTRGLSAFRDYQGQTRRACGAKGHSANVVRRFGVMENEPDWLGHKNHVEIVEDCWDCQEKVAATWHDVMATY